jgi:hypothetical protein
VEVFDLKEIVFVGLVLGFSVVVFGLIARAMIVDARDRLRFNVLQRGRRVGMDPSRKREQRAQVVELSARMPHMRRGTVDSTKHLGKTA